MVRISDYTENIHLRSLDYQLNRSHALSIAVYVLSFTQNVKLKSTSSEVNSRCKCKSCWTRERYRARHS